MKYYVKDCSFLYSMVKFRLIIYMFSVNIKTPVPDLNINWPSRTFYWVSLF